MVEASNLVIFTCGIFLLRGALNFIMLILMDLVWFHSLLMLFYGSIKVFQKTYGLRSFIVLLINLGLMLITHLLILLKLSKSLPTIVLFFSMLINMNHICYSCGLNLNACFFMMFGSLLFQLVGTDYVSFWTNSLVIFYIWK